MGKRQNATHILLVVLAITVAIAYMVSLFRFAESGFFSLNGGAAWLVIYGFVFKFVIGVRMLILAHSKRFDVLKRVFDVKTADSDSLARAAGGGVANLETIE